MEPQPPPAKSTPTLPPEIIYHIIEFAAPPPRLRSFRDRYNALRSFSLVDKKWRGIVQKILFRYIQLRTSKPYELLRDVLLAEHRRETGAGERLEAATEELRLGEAEQWTIAQVKILLHFLPSVSRIWMASKAGFRGPSVSVDSLSVLPHLTHLHLDNSDFTPVGAISLPFLSHLSFSDPTSVTNVLAFLNTPSSLISPPSPSSSGSASETSSTFSRCRKPSPHLRRGSKSFSSNRAELSSSKSTRRLLPFHRSLASLPLHTRRSSPRSPSSPLPALDPPARLGQSFHSAKPRRGAEGVEHHGSCGRLAILPREGGQALRDGAAHQKVD
ncbi:hypothetical protein BCR35DRAFT_302039 [Leucosporidium creatinivorum]|uniref:F-box domain-containing protein n=1 Tax=Leucosporidium creatinivorum TaxID=106004 RepID=A0A1Y2FVT5_9BASI|nr:hypothetical protein BCR35DRAFT_302039 [Leucosporidium creatinivorum]